MKFGPVRPRRTGTVRYGSVQNRRVKGDVQMEFSEFAGLLYPIIGSGDTTGRFTRKLFEKITDIPVSPFLGGDARYFNAGSNHPPLSF